MSCPWTDDEVLQKLNEREAAILVCMRDIDERDTIINELRATLAQREAQVRALVGFAQEILELDAQGAEFSVCWRMAKHGLLDASGQPTALMRGEG